jgi:Flp pilus assembly protein TadG
LETCFFGERPLQSPENRIAEDRGLVNILFGCRAMNLDHMPTTFSLCNMYNPPSDQSRRVASLNPLSSFFVPENRPIGQSIEATRAGRARNKIKCNQFSSIDVTVLQAFTHRLPERILVYRWKPMTPLSTSRPCKTFLDRLRPAKFTLFLRRESGAAAIEFAILSAPFIALMLAILQVTLIFFAQEALETTVEASARLVLTGKAPTTAGGMTAAQAQAAFSAAVCANSPGLFTCANFMIDLQPVSTFANANVTAPVLTYNSSGQVTNAWTYNPGNPGDIMVMRVMYQWPVFMGPLGLNLSNLPKSMRLLMSTAVFRNEP